MCTAASLVQFFISRNCSPVPTSSEYKVCIFVIELSSVMELPYLPWMVKSSSIIKR